MDPMDIYSQPQHVTQHALGILFEMSLRHDPRKKGRELFVPFDNRFPLMKEFDLRYVYVVRFLESGNAAGNHYHKRKHELLIPLAGTFDVLLEDSETKKSETLPLDAEDTVILYIRPGIAHTVVSKEKKGLVLVLASGPNTEDDEYPYKV